MRSRMKPSDAPSSSTIRSVPFPIGPPIPILPARGGVGISVTGARAASGAAIDAMMTSASSAAATRPPRRANE